jgi:TetR/AcrR family hemagglutinin/protease transcriptional regulator
MKTDRARKGGDEKRGSRDARLPQNQRRTQLLACALKVFAEHGISAGNHALVAAEADVAVPTVFFYFKTRDKLVDAVLTEVEHFVGSAFEAAMHVSEPADVTLEQLIRREVQALDTHPYHVRVFFEWGIAMRAEIWPRYLKLDKRMLAVLTQIIERGQREGVFRPDLVPEDEAQILHAASRALAQMKLTNAPQSRVERFLQSMVQTLLFPAQTATATKRARPAVARAKAAVKRSAAPAKPASAPATAGTASARKRR